MYVYIFPFESSEMLFSLIIACLRFQ